MIEEPKDEVEVEEMMSDDDLDNVEGGATADGVGGSAGLFGNGGNGGNGGAAHTIL